MDTGLLYPGTPVAVGRRLSLVPKECPGSTGVSQPQPAGLISMFLGSPQPSLSRNLVLGFIQIPETRGCEKPGSWDWPPALTTSHLEEVFLTRDPGPCSRQWCVHSAS